MREIKEKYILTAGSINRQKERLRKQTEKNIEKGKRVTAKSKSLFPH